MNVALMILRHAWRMLAHDPAATLRVILVPALVVIAAPLIMASLLPNVLSALASLQSNPLAFDTISPGEVFGLLLLALASLLAYALMAILWHRYVLLGEEERQSNLRPAPSVVMRYIGRAILVGLVQLAAAIPITIGMGIFGQVGQVFGSAIGGLVFLITGVLAGLLFLWIALRISLVLPAASLGQKMSLTESCEATAPLSPVLWGVATLLAILNTLISTISGGVMSPDITLSLVVGSVIYVAEGLIFISVLTTLYGHLIERRPLG